MLESGSRHRRISQWLPVNPFRRLIRLSCAARMVGRQQAARSEKELAGYDAGRAYSNRVRVALITANLGRIDPDLQCHHCDQVLPEGWEFDRYYFTEANFPLRPNAMHPRLQAKIPKMFGWKILPGYDYYIWLDAAFSLSHEGSVMWLVGQCRKADLAIFRHPERNSIQEELEYVEAKMSEGLEYLINRYAGEPMREQVQTYLQDKRFVDNGLFAGGAFIYRDNPLARQLLSDWFSHCCLHSVQDQLSLPYLVQLTGCRVRRFNENELNNPYVKYHWSH